MKITSFTFFGLLGVVYILLYGSYKLIKDENKNIKISNWLLLVSSYIFVLWTDYRYAVVLGLVTITTWLCAKYKKYVPLGVVVALAGLGFFKYMNFFAESYVRIVGNDYTALNIILPLGISFYTFSAISYMVDVKRGKLDEKGLRDVALYLAYFPKITSGPIQKSKEFFEQIEKSRKIGWEGFSVGIQIFVFGMFKKLVFADRLSVFVDQVYRTPKAFDSLTIFLAVIAYSLQIYFDFSGYSDMAIGVSKMLGIDLPRNFNLPYIAHNVTEFWKRWHITLSSWLQDYLYISLGGNRKGKIRTYVNLILTMVLGGIWHGASFTYIVWGLLHGVGLMVHKIWMAITGAEKKEHNICENIISILATFFFVSFCWIFFRAESITKAILIIRRMISFETGLTQPYLWLFVAVAVLLVAIIFAAIKSKKNPLVSKRANASKVDGFYPLFDLTTFWGLTFFFVMIGLVLCLAYTGGSPFIYGNY